MSSHVLVFSDDAIVVSQSSNKIRASRRGETVLLRYKASQLGPTRLLMVYTGCLFYIIMIDLGATVSSPAEMLLNKEINGWKVVSEMGSYQGQSGGNFSSGYIVEKDGGRAFLKAMDLERAFIRGAVAIQREISQYLFERQVLDFCGDKRLSGVIRLYDAGEIDIQNTGNPANIIYFLIFELADGDIRRELTVGGFKSNSWRLRVLHQSAVALVQLHNAEIAHQDLKPSNVLSFEADKRFKVGDLGRCTSNKFKAPTDVFDFPGDRSYAPPEYHYNAVPVLHMDKRLGSDAYLLGSLISFLFSNVGALIATLQKLPDEYRPDAWRGDYVDALPYLEKSHTEATLALKKLLPPDISEELASAYFNLSHPNPLLRGHPDARRQTGRPLGLDRYRSLFDRLTHKVNLQERIEEKKKASNA